MPGLRKNINDIIAKGDSSTNDLELKITLSVGSHRLNLNRIKTFKVNREFHKNYGDVVMLDCEMPLGDLVKIVYAGRTGLTFTVQEIRGGIGVTNRYRGVMLNDSKGMENELFKRGTRTDLNKEMGIGIFQLIDIQLETMMGLRKTGVILNNDIKSILTCTMAVEWRKIKYAGDKLEKDFSLVPPHNSGSLGIFQIPTDTRYLDFPQLIQKNDHGMYSGGVGTYIQNYIFPTPTSFPLSGKLGIKRYVRGLWVYPLYNNNKGGRKFKISKLFLSTKASDKEIARTYAIDPSCSVRLIATLDDEFALKSATLTGRVGSKDFRLDPTGAFIRSHQNTKDGNIIVNKGMYINESSYASPGSTKVMKHAPTANDYDFKTNSMQMEGRHIAVTWKFSVPDVLLPGMLLDVYIESEGRVRQMNGVLQAVYTTIDAQIKTSTSVLILFLSDKGSY